MRLFFAMLFVCWPSLPVAADDEALSVRIDSRNAGEITFNVSFDVILTNNTEHPIHIWNPESKNGYYQISFVFVDRKTLEEFQVRKRRIEDPDEWKYVLGDMTLDKEFLEIAPHKKLRIGVSFEDDWGGLPDPNQDRVYRVWASFHSDIPAPQIDSSVWTGTIGSPPVNTSFTATRLKTTEDYLKYGFTDTAIKLIKVKGAENLESKNDSGDTVLQNAAFHFATADRAWKKREWKRVADTYLELGAYYDIESAIYLNDFDRVKEILKKSPDQATGSLGERSSPLRLAALTGNLEVCRYLVEHFDVDVNDWERGAGYPIIKVALKYPNIVKLLIDHGADLKTRISWTNPRSGSWLFEKDATALHYAVIEAPVETVKVLLDSGIDITARVKLSHRNNQSVTALHLATGEMAETILRHPRFQQIDDQTRQSMLDQSLVMKASHSLSTCKLLLSSGADPNAVYEGVSAVQAAAMSRLRSIQNISIYDKNHNQEMKQIIELLRERGAKIDLFTAVVIEDEKEVARQLKASPKSVNSRSPEGYPAFFAAIDVQNMSIFQQFLNANAPENMHYRPDKNDEPESEIDIARQRSMDFASDPEKKRLADEILFRLRLRRKR